MTSRFKKLHLQSGRTVEEALTKPVRKKVFLGEYEIIGSTKDGKYLVFFYPKDNPNHCTMVADGLLTFKDAENAQQFDYIDRLKAIVIAKGGK